MTDLDFFRGMEDEVVQWILENAEPTTHIADTVVINEGSPPEAIYIVSSGLYAASVLHGPARAELGRLAPGSLFGEMSWLNGTKAAATVKAGETSEALVLPLRVIDEKCAGDTLFASRFMRAVARVLVQRQVQLNGLLLEQRARAAGEALSTSSELVAAFEDFRKAAAGTDRDQRSGLFDAEQAKTALRAPFEHLNQTLEVTCRALAAESPMAADMLGARVHSEFLPYLLTTQTSLRFYSKPRGYAGDFGTIEEIYENRSGGTGVGAVLDALILEQAPPQAVRNRRALLAGHIRRVVDGSHGPVRVMSLACGPAREVSDAFDQLPREKWPDVTLLDIDNEALELVQSRMNDEGRQSHIRTVQGNLIRLALGREELRVEPQDLVYSIGLIDYFNDEFVVRLLDWVHERLAPGGSVILGNFHTCNPAKAFMDYVLEWKLIHRDEADMQRLFASSRFGGCTQVVLEDAGVNLFAIGTKR